MPVDPAVDHPSRVRVLVVTHLFPTEGNPAGGPWVAEQVDALSEFVDVEVLCCARTGRDRSVIRDSGVKVTYLDTATPLGEGHLGLLASSWRYSRRLRAFLDAIAVKPSVLHSHFGFPDAVVVGRVANRLGIPHVATLHGSDVARVLPRRDVAGVGLRRAVQRAGAVVCVSHALAYTARALLGDEFPLAVIPGGVDSRTFYVRDDGPRSGLLYVGNLTAVKNVDVLIEALALARDSRVLPTAIVGDGALQPHLEGLVRRRELESTVTFLGTLGRQEVADRMRLARVLVLPSAREGWGAVVAEALACGTPVVASRVGGIPEILEEPAGGAFVDPGDPEQLSRAMLDAYERTWDPVAVALSSKAPTSRESARRLAELYQGLTA